MVTGVPRQQDSSVYVCPPASAILQLIQGKLADMYAATQATRAFVYQAAGDADAGVGA